MIARHTSRTPLFPSATRTWLVAVALAALSLPAQGAPGDIDTDFGDGGRVLAGGIAVPLPNSGLAVGRNWAYGFEVEFLDAQGKPNTALGSGGRTVVSLPPTPKAYFGTHSVRMPDGSLVFAGWVPDGSGSDARPVHALLRLTPRGDVDASFGTAGDGIAQLGRAPVIVGLAPQADGRLLVAHLDGDMAGDEIGVSCVDSSYRISRLLRDGSVDTGYGVGGTLVVPDLVPADCLALTLFATDATGAAVIGDNWRLRRITPNGRVDMSFGASTGVALPPFEGAILGGAMTPTGMLLLHSDQAFGRLTPDGHLDLRFGTGDGVLPLWGDGGGIQLDRVGSIALTPDGRHVYVQSEVSEDYMGDRICQVVARMSIDGALDREFGRNGRICTSFGRVYAAGRPLALDNGQPVFELVENGVHHFYRLLVDQTPSAGALSLKVNFNNATVGGSATFTVVRSAGKSGAVSVSYRTSAVNAQPGVDFVAATGRLEWPDGDDSDRTVTVQVLRSSPPDGVRSFKLDLSAPERAVVIGGSQVVTIAQASGGGATPPPVVTPPPPVTSPPPEDRSSGGGGAADEIVAILMLLLAGIARVRRSGIAACTAPVAAALGLGAVLAHGDANAAGSVDPAFGSGGQQPMADHFILDVVPTSADQMLVLSCPGSAWEYSCYNSLLLRRFTTHGWLDPNFGTGATWTLDADGSPSAIVQRPDGSLLVAGRLDDGSGFVAAATASGQRDPVFAGQSVLKLAQPVRALAVQGDGKLLVGTVPDSANFAECPEPGWTLQRLNPSGAIDPTFGAGGSVTSSMIDGADERNCDLSKIWAEPSGVLVTQTAAGLRRLRSDGNLDTTFGSADGLTATHGTVTRTAGGGFLGIAFTSDRWEVRRLDSDGRDDPTFGSGGRINLDVPGMLSDFGTIDHYFVERVAAAEDGRHYYASAFVSGRLKSTGEVQSGTFILRFQADGAVDTAYGAGGKVQLGRAVQLGNRGLFTQSSGKLIVAAGGAIYRLLAGDESSPGIVSAAFADPVPVVEGGRARVVVSRTAGDSTAISVRYLTLGQDAMPDLDFLAVSGKLSWAAGDDSDRIVEVPTIDDAIDESVLEFLVFQIIPAEGAPVITYPQAWIPIADNDPPPSDSVPPPSSTTPPTPPQSGRSGGGGAIGVTDAIALLGLWAAGVLRRRNWTLLATEGKFRRSNPGFDRGAGGTARISHDPRPRPTVAQDRLHHLRPQLRGRGAD